MASTPDGRKQLRHRHGAVIEESASKGSSESHTAHYYIDKHKHINLKHSRNITEQCFRAYIRWSACLGVDEYSGTSAVKLRKNSPERFSLGGGCLEARAKWSFSLCENIMEVTLSERARRDEDVGFGIT